MYKYIHHNLPTWKIINLLFVKIFKYDYIWLNKQYILLLQYELTTPTL